MVQSPLEDAPDDLTTRQVVAIWALEKGKLAFAKEQAEAALRIEAGCRPQEVQGSNVGRMLRGVVALWEKDWPEAENYFQMVVYDVSQRLRARTTSPWPWSSRTTLPSSSGRWTMR